MPSSPPRNQQRNQRWAEGQPALEICAATGDRAWTSFSALRGLDQIPLPVNVGLNSPGEPCPGYRTGWGRGACTPDHPANHRPR